jgi:hypothetical protein
VLAGFQWQRRERAARFHNNLRTVATSSHRVNTIR